MADYKNVTIEKSGAVALVRFDRKGARNAFNQETILELTDVARRYQPRRLLPTGGNISPKERSCATCGDQQKSLAMRILTSARRDGRSILVGNRHRWHVDGFRLNA